MSTVALEDIPVNANMIRLYCSRYGGRAVRGAPDIRDQLLCRHFHVPDILASAHQGQGYYRPGWIGGRGTYLPS